MQSVPSMFVVSEVQQLLGPFIARGRYRAFRGSKDRTEALQDGCILLPMQMSDVYRNQFSATVKFG